MNAQLQTALPSLRELNVSNHLIGDRQALQAAWERDGYWFFRDVLDQDVIASSSQHVPELSRRSRRPQAHRLVSGKYARR